MTNNVPARVRHASDTTGAAAAPEHNAPVDPRVARTTRALGRALVALLEERAFDAITVQDILDRAGVGRTAFYAHYRNKEDVLHSSYEGVFAWLEPLVERPLSTRRPGAPSGIRLFPVAEFLAHVGEERALVDALRRDGRLEPMWAMLAGYAARMIARRLDGWADLLTHVGAAGTPEGATVGARDGVRRALFGHDLLAHMLAGALVESVRWWLDRPEVATPAEVDIAFHELARGVLQRRYA